MAKLHVLVCRGRSLKPRDGSGSASPYCQVEFDGQRQRTETKQNTLNPDWNDHLDFHFDGPIRNKKVTISVFHSKGRQAHIRWLRLFECLGKVTIDGSRIPNSSTVPPEEQRYVLEPRFGCFSYTRGHVTLKLWWTGHETDAGVTAVPRDFPQSMPKVDVCNNHLSSISKSVSVLRVHSGQCTLLHLQCQKTVQAARLETANEFVLDKLIWLLNLAAGIAKECSEENSHWWWYAAVKCNRILEVQEILEELAFVCSTIKDQNADEDLAGSLEGLRSKGEEDKKKLRDIATTNPELLHDLDKYILQRLDSSNLPELEHTQVCVHYGNKLGKGSFGHVYKGTWHGKPVAVKEFSPARSELDVITQMQASPHIIQSIGYYPHKENRFHLVMELMKMEVSDFIRSNLNERNNSSLFKIIEVLLKIAKGVQFLHEQKILHRDLKPDNILVSFDDDGHGGHAKVKLVDFGTAKPNHNSEDVQTAPSGTKHYMAPEVWEGREEQGAKYGKSADIYSFGVTSFVLLTHRSPEEARELLSQQSELLPKELNDLIHQCLESPPDKRPTIKTVIERLHDIRKHILEMDPVCYWR